MRKIKSCPIWPKFGGDALQGPKLRCAKFEGRSFKTVAVRAISHFLTLGLTESPVHFYPGALPSSVLLSTFTLVGQSVNRWPPTAPDSP